MTSETPGALPRGRHNLDPETVAEHQRLRLVDAALAELSEHGYVGMRIDNVARRAQVSRRTLYEQFGGRENVSAHALGLAFADLGRAFVTACDAEATCGGQVRAAVRTAIWFATTRPEAATVCFRIGDAEPEAMRGVRERFVGGAVDYLGRVVDGVTALQRRAALFGAAEMMAVAMREGIEVQWVEPELEVFALRTMGIAAG
ncbi:MAG: TetR/AcrR family transcriptional regulator [Solirubrobacteraceae bacterium]